MKIFTHKIKTIKESRELLIKYASQYLEVSPLEIVVLENEHGKPFLSNHKDVNFSISHSKDLWAIVFDNKNIGIDIEYVKKDLDLERCKKIIKRFFVKEDFDYYVKNESIEIFYEMWTKKESMLKLIGTGLRDISRYSIFDKKYNFTCLFVADGYTAHICNAKHIY